MKQTISGVNYQKFQSRFQKYVGHSGSYLKDSRSLSESVCGYADQNRFAIWQNIGIRNFKTLTCGILRGEFQKNGSLVYRYEKRLDGVIFLIAMAVLSMVIGILAGIGLENLLALIPFAIIALVNVFFAIRHSEKDRQKLMTVLNQIIYERSES